MKLLHVISSMDPLTGGPCQGIRNSDHSLRDNGVEREVVSLDAPSASFLGHDPFPIHAIGPGKGVWCYSQKLIPWLLKNLNRFDAIIVNGLWLYHAYAVRRALILYEKKNTQNGSIKKQIPKLFIMPHGMLDPYFQRAKSRKLKSIRNWFYWKIIENKVISHADGLLFTCEEELLLARETFSNYKPKQEFNIGYGIVEPPIYTPAMRDAFLKNCPELKDEPYLLFLSRIHEKKGIDLLIKAYLSIKTKSTTKIPKLIIAGPGLETNYGKEMLHLTTQNDKLKDSILFTGMLTGNAKWGALYGCDAFVLPSHQENFGIAVAEALACSKPVLISNKVNIWREIKKEGGGIISSDTLDDAIEMLNKWLELDLKDRQTMERGAYLAYANYFKIGPAAKKMHQALISG